MRSISDQSKQSDSSHSHIPGSPDIPSSLFKQPGFLAYFVCQYLGAFNDNLYKNGVLGLITFGVISTELNLSLLNNLGALLFILPFFLLSGFAGQLADKYPPVMLIRRIKLAEIVIMSTAVICLIFESILGLMLMLLLMGSQSAFFGPIKYSILPRQIPPSSLIQGNGWVEMATFIAILTGTLIASFIIVQVSAIVWLTTLLLLISGIGYWVSRRIPDLTPAEPTLTLGKNPFIVSWQAIRLCARDKTLIVASIAISWFWFLGASYLTQIYIYSRDYLAGDQTVVMCLLAAFSIGIGMGSLLCRRLSGHNLNQQINLTVSVYAAIGISVFSLIIFALSPDKIDQASQLINAVYFLESPKNWLLLIGFLLVGAGGGLYIVPIYTMVQQRADIKIRARIISSVNILNALFMVGSAVFGILMLVIVGLTIPEFFGLLAILNLVMLGLLCRLDKQYWYALIRKPIPK